MIAGIGNNEIAGLVDGHSGRIAKLSAQTPSSAKSSDVRCFHVDNVNEVET